MINFYNDCTIMLYHCNILLPIALSCYLEEKESSARMSFAISRRMSST